jgi:hypothetical protein
MKWVRDDVAAAHLIDGDWFPKGARVPRHLEKPTYPTRMAAEATNKSRSLTSTIP